MRTITRDFFTVRDNWFRNLSSTVIPSNIQSLIQLGDNFSLPFPKKDSLTMEFIKNVENNIRKLPVASQTCVRNRSAPIINRLPSYSFPHSYALEELNRLASATSSFLKENPNLILTRADKGNVTVALNRDDYIQKMEALLNDRETYTVVRRDPSKTITSNLRDLLSRWKSSDFISSFTYKSLYCSDGILPRAYGLPKIHKVNCPLRIIVSCVDSPLYSLALFLHKIMYKYFPKPESHILNSFQLVKRLSNIRIEDNYRLISLDVVSLFTNIPLDMAVDSISNRWNYLSDNISIPKNEFLMAVNLVLRSTFFKFNNIIYQQTFGTPMGSPLSPVIADIVLQDLESRALGTLDFVLPFYFRYVDDVVCAAPSDSLEHVLNVFNSFHPRLQFTLEVGELNTLNFLDVSLIIRDNHIIFDLYRKPSFSGRYLNFWSQHPVCQKRGTVIGLVDRVFHLSDPVFHEKNFEFIINILLDNSYPIDFIFRTIRERIKKLFHDSLCLERPRDLQNTSVFFTVPFVSSISEKFKGITEDLNMRISYQSLNKLSRFIKVHKDPLPDSSRRNVVYKINCESCDASYVGQTGRQLHTRISEHKNQIRHNTTNHSVITEHRLNFDHNFAWDKVEILDTEPFYSKRLMSEMLFIKRQRNSINLQTDVQGLHHTYASTVERLPPL